MDEVREKIAKLGMEVKVYDVMKTICSLGECSAVEIERKTGLRQPEVSMTTASLYKKGYLNRSKEKSKRGRPIFLYTPKRDFDHFINSFISKIESDLDTTEKKLNTIKTLMEKR